MSKFKVEITENRTGGEIFSYHLQTKRGSGQWWGLEMLNSWEMRKAAEVLIEKANELDREKKRK